MGILPSGCIRVHLSLNLQWSGRGSHRSGAASPLISAVLINASTCENLKRYKGAAAGFDIRQALPKGVTEMMKNTADVEKPLKKAAECEFRV